MKKTAAADQRVASDGTPQSESDGLLAPTLDNRDSQAALMELEERYQTLAEELARKEAELNHIRRTLGWRLLSVYGRLKYRIINPQSNSLELEEIQPEAAIEPPAAPVAPTVAAESLQSPEPFVEASRHFDLSVGCVHTPEVVAVNHLRRPAGEEEWEATGYDPQFLLKPPYPLGWIKLTVHITASGRPSDHIWLYWDKGSGFTGEDSQNLGQVNAETNRFIYFDEELVGLRVDPLEGPDTFKVKTITLTRVTAAEAREGLQTELDEAAGPGPHYGIGRSDALGPPAGFEIPERIDPYDSWLEVNRWNSRREALLRDRLAELADLPTVTVVMPVYDPPPEFLNLAIQSVADQVYDRWELCIADDASRDQRVRDLLQQWASQDARIKVSFREQNGGISAASNTAAQAATGEFLVFMDNDDALSPDALAEMAIYVSEHPDTDVLYSDEDKIDPGGRRYDPGFKPDWSPELFLSYNYLNHPTVVRASVFWNAGGFRTGLNLAQDWDLGLRATEIARHVGHIPLVLYHWRAIPSSVAFSGTAKPMGMVAAREAVAKAFERRHVEAVVTQPDWAVAIACGYYSHRFPDSGPSVSILIPTRNQVDVLRACVESLSRTTYANYEVVILDNESDDPDTLRYLAASPHRVLRIPSPGGVFSFGDINNRAVEQVSSDYVLFLNNDTEVKSPEWLSQMVGYLGIPGVGAVGARLLYPDGRVQHAGVIHWSFGIGPWHAFRLDPAESPGFMGWSLVTRNCSAVTAACMLTPRSLFLELGAFDAETFPVAYNDVDYCYRLLGAGHRIVYCPSAELVHHESFSRGPNGDPKELANCLMKYRKFEDHYYNPNLSGAGAIKLNPRTLATGGLRKPAPTLICSNNLNLEGAPLLLLEIVLGLRERGVIDPIVYSPEDGPLRAEYESRDIRVEVRPHPLAAVHFTSAGYDIGMEVFANWIGSLGVELIYGNTLRTFYAIDAAKRLGLPSIWNPRESEHWQTYFDDFGAEIAVRALQCFGYPYKMLFVSKASMDKFAELDSRHNFIYIHDGLDRDKFNAGLAVVPRGEARRRLGIADDDVAILTVGTVCARKGQMDIPAAIARMDEETRGRMRWFVVGDRESLYSSALRAQRETLDEDTVPRLQIVLETPEVLSYYSAADLFVCTSRVESFPRVTTEAMAAGLPIITTPVFGIMEQVRPDRNALLYNPGDASALAQAVGRLVKDPDLRRRMGAESLVALDCLIDHDSMIEAYAAVFREAWLSGCPRGVHL